METIIATGAGFYRMDVRKNSARNVGTITSMPTVCTFDDQFKEMTHYLEHKKSRTLIGSGLINGGIGVKKGLN